MSAIITQEETSLLVAGIGSSPGRKGVSPPVVNQTGQTSCYPLSINQSTSTEDFNTSTPLAIDGALAKAPGRYASKWISYTSIHIAISDQPPGPIIKG
ncbi:hypothetical protein MGYG_08415 [Nannizzia gypsea CBS 118893]|uniref:Uncharacterized protein n=1 Tax=Arthroderma gypseum (strain ATCC MYA-4604 / CBS 118893) TaxID=535722 RepID=E4V5M8_ARTGP|nr:hypothetical protein MGYG_08415 [Nannizzia gypsea CBS 118893]EFR05403.1 hypothetical protein MGYG_08415 [Nannizzia gypsea CBS 118893]